MIETGTFERAMLANESLSEQVKKLPQRTENIFKDSYIFDFLDLPREYKERDLQKVLVLSLKDFILELGVGFSFIGEEYRLQVGNDDFYIDLLLKLPQENPSIGILLCREKDNKDVEYALSCSLSPAVVSEYEIDTKRNIAKEFK